MKGAPARLLSLPGQRSSVPVLIDGLTEISRELGLSDDLHDDLELVIEELFTNVADYGELPEDGIIEVRIERRRSILAVEIRDRGIAFNPLDHPPPDLDSPIEERRIGGLGIHFLRHKSDRRCYARIEGANVLRFAKRLTESD